MLADNQPLLVLDGEIDADSLAPFVRCCVGDTFPWLSRARRHLAQGEWRNQAIGNLTESDAVRLFKQKAGLKNGDSDEDIVALAAQLKFAAFPLALAARSMIIARQALLPSSARLWQPLLKVTMMEAVCWQR